MYEGSIQRAKPLRKCVGRPSVIALCARHDSRCAQKATDTCKGAGEPEAAAMAFGVDGNAAREPGGVDRGCLEATTQIETPGRRGITMR